MTLNTDLQTPAPLRKPSLAPAQTFGWITIGITPPYLTLARRLWLWGRIVGGKWDRYRVGPALAWELAAIAHPWHEPRRRWLPTDTKAAP